MSNSRFQAINNISKREARYPQEIKEPISRIFAKHVFNLDSIRKTVSEEACDAIVDAIEKGNKIDMATANIVATGMKTWAMEHGATHFTHWFQPMNGLTAEKHDAFFELTSHSVGIEKFTGDMLIQREPDASSFPNGGLRQTFEARGYTAWDPSSPAFIMDMGGGKSLCIPSLFVSYSGESLDKKTPLLKSIDALNISATEICNLFDKNVKRVIATLGVEQEYFLIDRDFFLARPDLINCGRSIFGAAPAKGQQLEDHYFGSIKERAMAFMNELESESYKLGIPLKTKHNEVAPHQFECAPIFEEANIANDHNLLLMDIMNKIALRHNLAILLHEKPFQGVNGSGKHNNWSMSTDTGKNLLSPGKSPQENLQFLLILACILKGLNDYSGLIRGSIASSGNDHRLGANEAPPAIISAFLGEQLDDILNNIESGKFKDTDNGRQISFGISKIPSIRKDNTDRNRTSPFAFTGNKFEFRAVGSSANSALPVYVLNTVFADTFNKALDLIKAKLAKSEDKRDAIIDVIRKFVKESKQIRFEGNGYSSDWVVEATKRGLPNITASCDAFSAFVEKKVVDLFERQKVLTKAELESRYLIKLERFIKDINIEANVAINLVNTRILPVCFTYQKNLAESVSALKNALGDSSSVKKQKELLTLVSNLIEATQIDSEKLAKEIDKAHHLEAKGLEKVASAFHTNVRGQLNKLRDHVDTLENLVDDELWTLPKYSEMLILM